MIIDVDSHGEPPEDVIAEAWQRAGLPPYDVGEVTMRFVAGDLLTTLPRQQWPALADLLPPGAAAIAGFERVEGFAYEGAEQSGLADPAKRLAWLDARGIDAQNIISLRGLTSTRFLDDRVASRDLIAAGNTYMGECHQGYTDRLWPTTALTFEDLDWAVAEMTRMRALGSRSFLISAVPVNGIPHFHSGYDKIWSAAVDLGMLAILHVGANPAMFADGWANVEGDITLLRQLGVCQGHQQIQVFLNGMVFGGVFERHPELTVLIAECGIHWFGGTVEHMEQRNARRSVNPRVYFGDYPWSLSPTEFVRRNVRITPLPTPDQNPLRLLEMLPESVVFSSDYAHNEGNPDPVTYYESLLADVPSNVQASFFGGSISEAFARMGHPLTLADGNGAGDKGVGVAAGVGVVTRRARPVDRRARGGIWAALNFADAGAGIRFMVEVLGFETDLIVPGSDPEIIEHSQLRWPEGGVVQAATANRAGNPFSERPTGTESLYVITADPLAVYERCTAAGVVVVAAPEAPEYDPDGLVFTIRDPEGNLWSFGTYAGESE